MTKLRRYIHSIHKKIYTEDITLTWDICMLYVHLKIYTAMHIKLLQ